MGVKEQGVLRSKSRLCKVFFDAKCVKLLRSKGFLLSKVFFEAKCASAGPCLVTILLGCMVVTFLDNSE
jgi:hypothetical protein